MRIIRLEWFALAAMTAPALLAQGNVAGPVAGYVFDQNARALRPILGIPGASVLGKAIATDSAAAYVAPRQNWAVTVTREGVKFVRLNAGGAVPLAVTGAMAAPEGVAFSPSGTAAALYTAGLIQVIKGMPDAPEVAATLATGIGDRVALTQAAPRRARREAGSVAVSDDGRYVLYNLRGSIRLIGAGGENFEVMAAGSSAVAAFAPGGDDAAVSDPAGAGIVLLRHVAGATTRQTLAPAGEDLRSTAGLAFSPSGDRLFAADGVTRVVAGFDLTTGERSATVCDCVPSGLYPMDGLFRLNEGGGAPVWLLDARAGAPRIVFVPASAE